ncbi:MAG: ABC-type transport auxiliary lipoprotein family protein [Pseudomonadota bacterium]
MLATASLLLAGCVSFETPVPESLLTLSPTQRAPVGMSATAAGAATEDTPGAIAVLTPEVPAKLDVLRLPVNVSDTEIAYLQDAIWIEKPARLFRRLLGETLRVKLTEKSGGIAPLIVDNDDTPVLATRFLRGTLSELSYDASAAQVVVRFDAIRTDAEGRATTRRFETRESVALPEAAEVGPALNRAANALAGEVADWMAE